MKNKISVFFLIFSLLLAAAPFSSAQTSQNDWNEVQKIAVGTNVFIKTSDGKTVKGSSLSADEDKVELSVKGSRLSLPKNNIEAIYLGAPKSGKRAKLIGLAVGFLAGVAVGGAINKDAVYEDDYNYSAAALLTIAGAVGGVFIGGLFGKGKKKGALIYKGK